MMILGIKLGFGKIENWQNGYKILEKKKEIILKSLF